MNFNSIEQIQTKQGTIFKVKNPKDCKNFYRLKNQKVNIDDTQYVVIDVKRQRFRCLEPFAPRDIYYYSLKSQICNFRRRTSK